MNPLQLGARVTLKTRTFVVRGVSPMSVQPAIVDLTDVETGERVEVRLDELENAGYVRAA